MALWVMTMVVPLGITLLAADRPQARSSIRLSELDLTVRPADDFFQYVNGLWFKQHPIPADRSGWGVDAELQEASLSDLKAIVERLDASATGDRLKLRDFYATAMDAAKLNEAGLKPLEPDLAAIHDMADREALTRVVGHLQAIGCGPLFGIFVDQDQKHSEQYALHLGQGGTSLPEAQYYLGDDVESRKIRQAYREHLRRMFILLGDTPARATAEAGTVLNLETRLAEKQMTPTELRDPEPQYNKMSLAQLAELAPGIDWKLYFEAIGVSTVKEVIVCQPDFFRRVSELWREVDLADWRSYLRWHLIASTASCLNDPLVEEDFRFEQVLGGAQSLTPRWKRAIATLDGFMGDAVGRLYVDEHFDPQAKQRIDRLMDDMVAAFAERIRTRPWMTPATQAKALAKLGGMRRKLGYPNKLRDYSALTIKPDHYVLNCCRAAEFEFHRGLSRLGKPVDRDEWLMSVPSINACYSATTNDITFPAGILQPPFFDPKADDALNYGAIGATIGHEMTHGFDDEGCKFDAAGNLANWWTAADLEGFHSRAKQLVGQYDACVVIDNIHVNGELTLGENIADLGGLSIALDAYQRSLKGRPAPVIDGLTGLQRFFISYAIGWRTIYQPEQLRVLLRADEHAPPRCRVLTPLSNMPAFYEAFGVKEGDGMYRSPAERAEVW